MEGSISSRNQLTCGTGPCYRGPVPCPARKSRTSGLALRMRAHRHASVQQGTSFRGEIGSWSLAATARPCLTHPSNSHSDLRWRSEATDHLENRWDNSRVHLTLAQASLPPPLLAASCWERQGAERDGWYLRCNLRSICLAGFECRSSW